MNPSSWTDAQRDRLTAVLTAVFAASCVSAARGIEDSLLSDAVGAGGVPQGVGLAMGAAAVALFVKSFRGPAGGSQGDNGETDAAETWLPVLLRTAGLVAILLLYALLLPRAGYVLAISALMLASGWLAGAAFRPTLWLCAGLGGPLLWTLFDRLLQVRMPVGTWWG
jgi:putative tricarboxylic transport membrane protein